MGNRYLEWWYKIENICQENYIAEKYQILRKLVSMDFLYQSFGC